MLKISDEHSATFKELEQRNNDIQGLIGRVMQEAHKLHSELAADAKAHWATVMQAHGLEGNWRFQDGKLHPVQDAPQGAQEGHINAVPVPGEQAAPQVAV